MACSSERGTTDGGRYHETYCTHLPSPTTVYSGAKICTPLSDSQPIYTSTRNHDQYKREVRIVSRLATAKQQIEVGVVSYRKILARGEEGEIVDSIYDCYEGNGLPRGQHQALADMLGDATAAAEDENDPSLTCVAHSCLPHNDCASGDRSSSGATEAFVLRRMESSDGATTDTSTAAAEGGSSDRQPKQHRRHVSGSGSAGASSLRVVDSLDSMTIDSIAGFDASSVSGMDSQASRAILVLSGLRVPIPSPFGGSDDATMMVTCERPLNYIPLATRTTALAQKDGTKRVAVFVSGADDSRLHLYIPREESNASNRAVGLGALRPHFVLEEVPIFMASKPSSEEEGEEETSENLLSFRSTIMSIDCLHSEYNTSRSGENESSNDSAPINYIAMGCQDGIVRVVSYTYEQSSQSEHKFTVVGSSDLVVDGPIVTLDISSRTRQMPSPVIADSSIPQKSCTLVVGSLCGFACAFHQSGGAEEPFGLPEEIISNLWCGRIGAEDGVLCVKSISNGTNTCVAIGTYSGRVLIFEPTGENTSNYKLYWSCQLPYPIHAISSADLDGDGLNEILLTTRRSIHVFSCQSE